MKLSKKFGQAWQIAQPRIASIYTFVAGHGHASLTSTSG